VYLSTSSVIPFVNGLSEVKENNEIIEKIKVHRMKLVFSTG
jgi:hypothetical protein